MIHAQVQCQFKCGKNGHGGRCGRKVMVNARTSQAANVSSVVADHEVARTKTGMDFNRQMGVCMCMLLDTEF